MVRRLPSSEGFITCRFWRAAISCFDVDQLGRVVAGVAGVAVFVPLVVVHRLAQRRERKIAERIGLHEAADLLDVWLEAISSLLRGRIHAVEAGRNGGRAGDAQVHFARAGLPHHAHDLAAGGAAHDGIVHQHHALALQQMAHRIELQLDAEIADGLRGLDEGAAHVMIADQRLAERQAGSRRNSRWPRRRRNRAPAPPGRHRRGIRAPAGGPDSRAIPPPRGRTRSNRDARNRRARRRTARAAAPAPSARA